MYHCNDDYIGVIWNESEIYCKIFSKKLTRIDTNDMNGYFNRIESVKDDPILYQSCGLCVIFVIFFKNSFHFYPI